MFVQGAQRASGQHLTRFIAVLIIAALAAAGTLAARPAEVTAASGARPKVVIVVGPVAGNTRSFIRSARTLARAARSYGARVTEVYSPYATWTRVKRAARGANLFIYLGHGNGWPSPYAPFQRRTKDGLGLNPRAGKGNRSVKYYGEASVASGIKLARNSVVLLHRLCYATGNGEMGQPNPTRSTAKRRVDNYAAGFLRTGARVVFGEGHTSPRYVLHGLLRTNRTMRQIFWSAPRVTKRYAISFSSSRTRGAKVVMDPYRPGRYFRAAVGDLSMRASAWRSGKSRSTAARSARPAANAPAARVGSAVTRQVTPLRAGPSTTHRRVETIRRGAVVRVLGSRVNRFGNRWYRVRLANGEVGWASGRLLQQR